jgi:hypothetical protein
VAGDQVIALRFLYSRLLLCNFTKKGGPMKRPALLGVRLLANVLIQITAQMISAPDPGRQFVSWSSAQSASVSR